MENTYNFPRPYQVYCTYGFLYQLMKNRHTYTHVTDERDIYNMGEDERGRGILIEGIYPTPHLLNDAESNTTAAFAVVAPRDLQGNPIVHIVESYPLWNYPIGY